MDLLERLYALETTPPEERNILRSYLPYRSKALRSKSGLFDYQFVAGKVLCAFLGKSLAKRSLGQLRTIASIFRTLAKLLRMVSMFWKRSND